MIVQCINSACTRAQYHRSTRSRKQINTMQPLRRTCMLKKIVVEESRRKELTASAIGEFVLSIISSVCQL